LKAVESRGSYSCTLRDEKARPGDNGCSEELEEQICVCSGASTNGTAV